MNYARVLLSILLLALLPGWVRAQDPASGDDLNLDGVLLESTQPEGNGASLILDNTRTKVGKDFYDLFYKHWTARQAKADTSREPDSPVVFQAVDVIITVDEIPSPGTASQILISIDDQPVWQQFVQARYDLLEDDARYALEVVRHYLASYQDTQTQLGTQDQKGSGVY